MVIDGVTITRTVIEIQFSRFTVENLVFGSTVSTFLFTLRVIYEQNFHYQVKNPLDFRCKYGAKS